MKAEQNTRKVRSTKYEVPNARQAADLTYGPVRTSYFVLRTCRPCRRRGGFTLVELMVTMAIIAILGAAMAYAVAARSNRPTSPRPARSSRRSIRW